MIWGPIVTHEQNVVSRSGGRDRNVVFFLLITLIWGGAWVVIKIGLETLPPILFAALRMDVGAVVLVTFVVLREDYWRPRTRDDVVGILAGGLVLLFAGTSLLYLGLQSTTSSVGSIVTSLSPVITVALATVMLPTERLSRVGLLGVVVAFVGVGLVVQPDPSNVLTGNLRGEELLLAGTIFIGIGNVLIRWSKATIPPVALTAWALVIAAVSAHVLSYGIGERLSMVDLTEAAIGAVLYLGLLEMAVAIALYFVLITDIGATRASFVQYTVPIVTVITGWLVLSEQLSLEALVGFLVIFLGFLLLNYDDIVQISGRLRRRVTTSS